MGRDGSSTAFNLSLKYVLIKNVFDTYNLVNICLIHTILVNICLIHTI